LKDGLDRGTKPLAFKDEPPRVDNQWMDHVLVVPKYKLLMCTTDSVDYDLFQGLFRSLNAPTSTELMTGDRMKEILVSADWNKAVFYRHPVDRLKNAYRWSDCSEKKSERCRQVVQRSPPLSFQQILFQLMAEPKEIFRHGPFAPTSHLCGGLGSTLQYYNVVHQWKPETIRGHVESLLRTRLGIDAKNANIVLNSTDFPQPENITQPNNTPPVKVHTKTMSERIVIEHQYSDDYDLFKFPKHGHRTNCGPAATESNINTAKVPMWVVSLQGVNGSHPSNAHRFDAFRDHVEERCGFNHDFRIEQCPGQLDSRRGYGVTKALIECLDRANKEKSEKGNEFALFFEDDARFYSRTFCDASYRASLWSQVPEDAYLAMLGGHHFEFGTQHEENNRWWNTTLSYGAYGFAVPATNIAHLRDGFKSDLVNLPPDCKLSAPRGKPCFSPDVRWYDRHSVSANQSVYSAHPLEVMHKPGFSNTWNINRTT